MAIKNEIIMKIDEIGRLVIPKKYREVLDICNDKSVLLVLDNDKIIIKKNKKEQHIEFVTKYFVNTWNYLFKNDTILITNLENIIKVYNRNKHFINYELDLEILEKVKSANFKSDSFSNKKLFSNNKDYFFDMIALESDNKKVGSIILIHDNEQNLDENFRTFLFHLLKNIN